MLGLIESIGVGEIHVKRRGKVFWTLVYQIDSGTRRLLWIGEDRSIGWARKFLAAWIDAVHRNRRPEFAPLERSVTALVLGMMFICLEDVMVVFPKLGWSSESTSAGLKEASLLLL